MKQMLFYEKPVPLHREHCAKLRLSALTDLGFSKVANSVPVTGLEFFGASRDLPILFRRSESGDYQPLALLSLKQGGHTLVDGQGRWQGAYVPAFIRRYPFALLENGAVCYDAACSAFSTEQGTPLFNEDGTDSDALRDIVKFLMQYNTNTQRTREFCAALAERDMFRPLPLQVEGPGHAPVRLDGLYAIDDGKVRDLPDELVTAWFRNGWLMWIFAHRHSLGALQQLAQR